MEEGLLHCQYDVAAYKDMEAWREEMEPDPVAEVVFFFTGSSNSELAS